MLDRILPLKYVVQVGEFKSSKILRVVVCRVFKFRPHPYLRVLDCMVLKLHMVIDRVSDPIPICGW